MRGHTIICGYGRIGRHVHQFLEMGHLQVVVIEMDEGQAQLARDSGLSVVAGDATDDNVLVAAGLETARLAYQRSQRGSEPGFVESPGR